VSGPAKFPSYACSCPLGLHVHAQLHKTDSQAERRVCKYAVHRLLRMPQAHLELPLALLLLLLVCCLLVGLHQAGPRQALSWQQQLLLARHCPQPAKSTRQT
jgi:hypothetical protein